jgi:hypothetical protein
MNEHFLSFLSKINKLKKEELKEMVKVYHKYIINLGYDENRFDDIEIHDNKNDEKPKNICWDDLFLIKETINWHEVCTNKYIPEKYKIEYFEFLMKEIDLYNLYLLVDKSSTINFLENYIIKNLEEEDGYIDEAWETMSADCDLSFDFLIKYKEKIDKSLLERNKNINEEVKKKFLDFLKLIK